MRYVDPEIFATWSARLAAEAEGLDFALPADRAVFRVRVGQAVTGLASSFVGRLAREAGHRGPLAAGLVAAAGALADARIGCACHSIPARTWRRSSGALTARSL